MVVNSKLHFRVLCSFTFNTSWRSPATLTHMLAIPLFELSISTIFPCFTFSFFFNFCKQKKVTHYNLCLWILNDTRR